MYLEVLSLQFSIFWMYFWLVFFISSHCVSPPLRKRWRRRWSSIVVVTAGFATNPSGIGSTSLPLHLTNTPAQKLIIAPPQNTTPNTVPNSTSYYSSIAARSFRGFRRGVVPEGAGDAMVHPDFGRSVNPISARGDRLYQPNCYWHPWIFRPSDGPAVIRVTFDNHKRRKLKL